MRRSPTAWPRPCRSTMARLRTTEPRGGASRAPTAPRRADRLRHRNRPRQQNVTDQAGSNSDPNNLPAAGTHVENTMRRLMMAAAVAAMLSVAGSSGVRAQGETYRLVPNWPTLPAGMWFGLKEAPPPPAEREAQAAARRARGGTTGGGGLPTNQPGISGLAIDQHDRIFVFNRGPKPVMVFDPAGTLLMAGADGEYNGKKINPDWEHSGGVDWDGNVYIIERDAHRIVKLNPKMDTFLMQIGTTMQKGNDATHLNL